MAEQKKDSDHYCREILPDQSQKKSFCLTSWKKNRDPGFSVCHSKLPRLHKGCIKYFKSTIKKKIKAKERYLTT